MSAKRTPSETMSKILGVLEKHLPLETMAIVEGHLWTLQADAERVRSLEAKLAKAHDQADYDDLDRQFHDALAENRLLEEKILHFRGTVALVLGALDENDIEAAKGWIAGEGELSTSETQDEIARRRAETQRTKGRSRSERTRRTTRGRSR